MNEDKIIEKFIEDQKKCIQSKDIFSRLEDKTVTNESFLEAFDEKKESIGNGIIKISPSNIDKTIKNMRNEYTSSTIEILNRESIDNALDKNARNILINICLKAKYTILSYTDDGGGMDDIPKSIGISCKDKNIHFKGVGFIGIGFKVLSADSLLCGITETKRKDGSVEAILWWFSYAKNDMAYMHIEPSNIIETRTGTHVEYYFLQSEFTGSLKDIEDEIIVNSMLSYRNSLLDDKVKFSVNGEQVIAEPYPEGNTLSFDNGKLIVTDNLLPENEQGLDLCIFGRNVRKLDLVHDFRLDVPRELASRITGYLKASELKVLLTLSKENILKNKPEWNAFRNKYRQEILNFLEHEGYLVSVSLRGSKKIEELLQRDIQLVMKKDKIINDLIKTISGDADRNHSVPGEKTETVGGAPALTQEREGEGSIKGVIIFGAESSGRGFHGGTPTIDFFNKNPLYLYEKQRAIIHVYKAFPNQALTRLTPDIEIEGHEFLIENVPLDVPLLVTATTAFGNPTHLSPILGRPRGYIILTSKKKVEHVVLPIGVIKPGFNIIGEPRYLKGTEYAVLEQEENKPTRIVYDTSHPFYNYCDKSGDKYTFIINAVAYALSKQAGEGADDVYNRFLKIINGRL